MTSLTCVVSTAAAGTVLFVVVLQPFDDIAGDECDGSESHQRPDSCDGCASIAPMTGLLIAVALIAHALKQQF